MYREQALVIVAMTILAGITYFIGKKFFAFSENQIDFVLIVIVVSFIVGGIVMNIGNDKTESKTTDTSETAEEDVC